MQNSPAAAIGRMSTKRLSIEQKLGLQRNSQFSEKRLSHSKIENVQNQSMIGHVQTIVDQSLERKPLELKHMSMSIDSQA